MGRSKLEVRQAGDIGERSWQGKRQRHWRSKEQESLASGLPSYVPLRSKISTVQVVELRVPFWMVQCCIGARQDA